MRDEDFVQAVKESEEVLLRDPVGVERGWVGSGEGAVEGGAEGFLCFWGSLLGLVSLEASESSDSLRGITHGRARVGDDSIGGLGLGGSEFTARDGPGIGAEYSSYGGGTSLSSKCGVEEVALLGICNAFLFSSKVMVR